MQRPPMQPRASSSSYPPASLARMILSPFVRLSRRLIPPWMPTSFSSAVSLRNSSTPLVLAFTAALQRLDLSRDPGKTIRRIRKHHFTIPNTLPLLFMAADAVYCFYFMALPIPFKLIIPAIYLLAVFIPLTSQFFWPATPVLAWVLLFFTARFIPSQHRPGIHVALLPALESVFYGANISDLQTRYTNPLLDVLAWLPYGIGHFSIPFGVALVLWVLGPKGATQYWGKAFGWMNLLGVMTQILFPCAAPWYEIIHGLTPANYGMPGSPGGLLRIDRALHASMYTNAFGNAPLVFGAFPSLHSGCAVMEALFLSHFFPQFKVFFWGYVGVLWWATMYLSHHYLIDLTAGASLSVMMFYAVMPEQFKDVDQIIWREEEQAGNAAGNSMGTGIPMDGHPMGNGDALGSYEQPTTTFTPGLMKGAEFENELNRLEREDGPEDPKVEAEESGTSSTGGKKSKRTVSWGETKVMGEMEAPAPEEV